MTIRTDSKQEAKSSSRKGSMTMGTLAEVITMPCGHLKGQSRAAASDWHIEACPVNPELTAEMYLLHWLPSREAELFEEHFLACENCAAILSISEDYISTVREACVGLRSGGVSLIS